MQLLAQILVACAHVWNAHCFSRPSCEGAEQHLLFHGKLLNRSKWIVVCQVRVYQWPTLIQLFVSMKACLLHSGSFKNSLFAELHYGTAVAATLGNLSHAQLHRHFSKGFFCCSACITRSLKTGPNNFPQLICIVWLEQ